MRQDQLLDRLSHLLWQMLREQRVQYLTLILREVPQEYFLEYGLPTSAILFP
jgi:hypothetical protein